MTTDFEQHLSLKARLITFIVGVVVLAVGVGLMWFKVAMPGAMLFVWLLIAFLGVCVIIAAFVTPRHYCEDCGQYVGVRARPCPRCGCNRSTRNRIAVGQTIKHR